MEILRRGSEGDDVRRWQHFLYGRGLLAGVVDGLYGGVTEKATRTYQRRRRLQTDGQVGPLTYAAALRDGFDPGFTDPHGGTSGGDWPPPPIFPPLVANAEREAVFGRFEYQRISPTRDHVRIVGGWEAANIVQITVPQLAGITGAPKSGRIRVHKLVREQIGALFEAWEKKGLLPLVRTWAGGFVPRFVRGSSTALSNHTWGTAFDINADWNPLGTLPPLRSRPGSVRELVPDAHELGFYWGGHFSRRDGMHFEVARALG